MDERWRMGGKLMKVKFIEDCEIEVFDDINQDNGEIITFKSGQVVDFDIIGYGCRFIKGLFVEDPAILNVRFTNDKYAFGIMKEWFRCLN